MFVHVQNVCTLSLNETDMQLPLASAVSTHAFGRCLLYLLPAFLFLLQAEKLMYHTPNILPGC